MTKLTLMLVIYQDGPPAHKQSSMWPSKVLITW